MKKPLALILSATLLLAGVLAGCSGSTATPPSTTTAASSTAASGAATSATGEVKIGFSISSRDQFLSALETALIDAAKTRGADITTFDAEQDVQKQLDHVTTFAAQGFSAIIINLVETNLTEQIIKTAGDIPVIFVNRMPDMQFLREGIDATVGSDESQSGGLQAKFVAEYFKDKEPKELNVVLLMGTLGLQHTTKRTEFAKSGLTDAGFTLNMVFEDTAEYDRAKAMEKMQQFLGTGKEFDVVICNNDEMALGVIEALRAGGDTNVPVVGIDATGTAMDAIEKGELACSVFQNAKGQGENAMDVAYKAATGEAFETENWVPFELVTIDNVADYKA